MLLIADGMTFDLLEKETNVTKDNHIKHRKKTTSLQKRNNKKIIALKF